MDTPWIALLVAAALVAAGVVAFARADQYETAAKAGQRHLQTKDRLRLELRAGAWDLVSGSMLGSGLLLALAGVVGLFVQ